MSVSFRVVPAGDDRPGLVVQEGMNVGSAAVALIGALLFVLASVPIGR